MKTYNFRFIDLFCGIGGFHQAMTLLGGRCVFASDINEQCREVYANDFALMLHIENTISQIDDDYLYGIKYDELYLKNNIRFFDAKDIPHFNEKSLDGVFNAEYDCNLEIAQQISMDEMKLWIA